MTLQGAAALQNVNPLALAQLLTAGTGSCAVSDVDRQTLLSLAAALTQLAQTAPPAPPAACGTTFSLFTNGTARPAEVAPSCHAHRPPTPRATYTFGDFVAQQQRRVDPLVIQLWDLQPPTPNKPAPRIFVINRTEHLDKPRPQDVDLSHGIPGYWVEIPVTDIDSNGRATLAISDEKLAGILHTRQAGAVMETFAVEGHAVCEKSNMSAINQGGAGRIANPLVNARQYQNHGVPPAAAQLPQMQLHPDVKGPAIVVAALKQSVSAPYPQRAGEKEIAISVKPGVFGIEPFSKVRLATPPYYDGNWTENVRADGQFTIKTTSKPGEAMLLCAYDHSTGVPNQGIGTALTERRVVFTAGQDNFVVVDNPKLGTQKPLEASVGRIAMSTKGIEGTAGAATKGAIVWLENTNAKNHMHRFASCTVGPDGKFVRAFDENFPVADGDVVTIKLKHAFGDETLTVDLGGHTARDVCEGRGVLLSDTCTAPVSDNAMGPLRVQVASMKLSFSTYDNNTGNRVSIGGTTDWTGTTRALVNFDAATNEVVVRFSMQEAEGQTRRETLESGAIASGFAGGDLTWNAPPDGAVPQLRRVLSQREEGDRLPVRFESDDGEVLSRGSLVISTVCGEHSTGSPQKIHPVWMATLDPASLST